MAHIWEPTKEQAKSWAQFVASRPQNVRAVAERFNPWTLYRLAETGQRVTVYLFDEHEDGSVTLAVNVTAQFNAVMMERQVFGIKPDDLEECDLPNENEPVGAMLSAEEVDENIDALRCMIRPDLFTMGEDGKAVRKQ